MPFERIAIIGTGLLGASVGLAIKAAQPGARIVGSDLASANARGARKAGAVDSLAEPAEAVRGADLVVVATPLGAMPAVFQQIASSIRGGAVVTDTGSTKARVMAWADEYLPAASFVGGHPMAGKTSAGPAAADAALFLDAVWCLTPAPAIPGPAVDALVDLIGRFGARPYFVDPDEHDGLVASISHLPYLMAIGLVAHLGREPGWREAATLAAGGFRYASHLSDSDPRMFADISATNRDNLVRRLDGYLAELHSLRDAIAADDPRLRERFEQARNIHQDWLRSRDQN